jgi:hypothetical protein
MFTEGKEMKTRTALAITISAILAVGAIDKPAHAAVALWSEDANWTVVGDNNDKWCTATTYYKSGRKLHIARNPAGWNFSVSGINVTTGHSYSVDVATKYSGGNLVGIATNEQQVVFMQINEGTLANLMLAPSIAIQDLGIFPLRGSAKAVRQVNACFNALTGIEL